MKEKNKRAAISISTTLSKQLKEYCNNHGLKMQYVAEKAIEEWLEQRMNTQDGEQNELVKKEIIVRRK
jgi:2-oxoglutarate dehydrogenase complex dehydrogenase (E1) component-like enzyme